MLMLNMGSLCSDGVKSMECLKLPHCIFERTDVLQGPFGVDLGAESVTHQMGLLHGVLFIGADRIHGDLLSCAMMLLT